MTSGKSQTTIRIIETLPATPVCFEPLNLVFGIYLLFGICYLEILGLGWGAVFSIDLLAISILLAVNKTVHLQKG